MPRIFSDFHGLCLREWKPDDIPRYAELIGDPDVMKFIGDGSIRSIAKAREEIESFQQEIQCRGWSRWAVSFGEYGLLMGYAGYAQRDDGIEFGIRFLHRYWGTIYPFIAGCLSVKYGFECMGFESAYCINDPRHKRAVRLAERISRVVPTQIETPQGIYNKFTVTREFFYGGNVMLLNRKVMDKFASRLEAAIVMGSM